MLDPATLHDYSNDAVPMIYPCPRCPIIFLPLEQSVTTTKKTQLKDLHGVVSVCVCPDAINRIW